MKDDPHQIIRRLAALSGTPLPEERIAALVPILALVRAQADRLAEVDYGEAEPAAQFRPRREAPR